MQHDQDRIRLAHGMSSQAATTGIGSTSSSMQGMVRFSVVYRSDDRPFIEH